MIEKRLDEYAKIIRYLTKKIIEWDYEFQDLGILQDLDIDYEIIKVTNEECGDVLKEIEIPDIEEPRFYLLGKIYHYLHSLPENYILPPDEEVDQAIDEAVEHNKKIYICKEIF